MAFMYCYWVRACSGLQQQSSARRLGFCRREYPLYPGEEQVGLELNYYCTHDMREERIALELKHHFV